ncbi:hypothetical protein [Alkalihalobacillus sp. TS-13]|uniref:hypothetical protein n=1 Tax=Alkalihalobacillus sp. TS-13 TaxID=2842455 RepID=UPI001C88AF6D|nr:hypothetical protein [Alkalihalobacillus sp. TS-13]
MSPFFLFGAVLVPGTPKEALREKDFESVPGTKNKARYINVSEWCLAPIGKRWYH